MTTPAGFRTETGTTPFAVEAAWRLVVPDGAPPAGGWPLVVALHGWGMNADYFSHLCEPLLFPGAAFLFPQGPYPFEMRRAARIRIGWAWYLFDGKDEPFRSTLGRTEEHLLGLIDRLCARSGSDGDPTPALDGGRVFLLGFSQGAYTGYFLALRNSGRFRGMVALGGGRLREDFVADRIGKGPRIPFLLVHGAEDESVPLERTELMKAILAGHGFPVELRVVPGGHEISGEMLAAARKWLLERVAEPDSA